MSSINVLNSGLDVQSTVDQLIQVERQPIVRLEQRTSALQGRVTAYQTLNTKVSSLLDKLDALLFHGRSVPSRTAYDFQDQLALSVFGAVKASSSDTSSVAVTAGTAAVGGNYSLTVSSLAQAQAAASQGFQDTTSTLVGTGTLVIQRATGDPVTVSIDSTNNTLEGLRRAINAAGAGVTATILNDGSSTPYRLVLTASQTGTANAFTVTDNLAGGTALDLNQTVAASDAHLQVNGLNVTKASNTVTDVIDGVTLTLQKATSAPVLISVERNFDAVITAFKDLAAAYNEVNSFAKTQSTYNSSTKTSGVLAGDATLNIIVSRIREILTRGVTNDLTPYRVVSQAGIGFARDGTLTIDETKLRAALERDPNQVAALVLGPNSGSSSGGLLVDLRTALASITDPLSGPIHHATDALNQSIRRIQDQIDSYEERLESRRELLMREYSRADQALRLMTVLQTSLSSQMSSLSGM